MAQGTENIIIHIHENGAQNIVLFGLNARSQLGFKLGFFYLLDFVVKFPLWEAAIVMNLLKQVKNSHAQVCKREQAIGITEEGSWHAK